MQNSFTWTIPGGSPISQVADVSTQYVHNLSLPEASTRIKSNMYTQALQLMKKDQEDKDAAEPQAVEYADDDDEDFDE